MLHGNVVHPALCPLHFGKYLTDLKLQLTVILHDRKPVKKLGKRGGRICRNRLHGIHILQGIINSYRIIDFKVGLMNLWAEPGGTAHHLLKENTAFDAAHKDKRRDLGHVNAGGQQVNRDGNAGVTLILKALEKGSLPNKHIAPLGLISLSILSHILSKGII